MRKTQTRVIDEIEVSVTPWNPRRAIKNKLKLSKLIGPVLGTLGDAINISSGKAESALDSEVNVSKIGEALEILSDKLEDNKFDAFVELILEGQLFNKKEYTYEMFDVVFSDSIFAFYKTVLFVLEVNYKDFFVKSGIGNLLKEQKTVSLKK